MEKINCACVIHGSIYSWDYVERLYEMLRRNLSRPVELHVFTEPHRGVPNYFVKHDLDLWPGISGPKKAWWYKMQLFNPSHQMGRTLYMDLDVTVTGDLDWIWQLEPTRFWAVRDFLYLWRPGWQRINSSVMYWDSMRFPMIWEQFHNTPLDQIIRQYPGDQDFIYKALPQQCLSYFDENWIKSWRWQISDGGVDITTRKPRQAGAGAVIDSDTKIVVFHGDPKPHQVPALW